MKTLLTVFCLVCFSIIVQAQDSAKIVRANDATQITSLQSLKSLGFNDIDPSITSDNKNSFEYVNTVMEHDTSVVSGMYKLKLKFSKGFIVGKMITILAAPTGKEISKNTTAVKIKMLACCTPRPGHPQHCCDPSEIKEYTKTKQCSGWTFVVAQ